MRPFAVCLLLLGASKLLAADVPEAFRVHIVNQTPEEWQMCVMSSHADRLLDGRSDSDFVGVAPADILAVKKILVSMPSAAKPATQLTPEAIFDAVQEYVLVPPGSTERPLDPSTVRWVEFTGLDDREFRITFMSGVPVEVLIRKDRDTVVRFSLRKKAKSLQSTDPSGRG